MTEGYYVIYSLLFLSFFVCPLSHYRSVIAVVMLVFGK